MEYQRISVLVPTRQRIQRLQRLLDSLYDTVRDTWAVEILFRIDEDDFQTREYLLTQGLAENEFIGPRCLGYRSMPQFFNELAWMAKGDVLICGNDDMHFRTKGWEWRVLETANRYPDGIFDIGYHTHNETHFPFTTVSKKLVGHLGFLWDPSIFWGDIYHRDIALHFGRAVMLSDVHIEHEWIGFNPDKVFSEHTRDVNQIDPTYWGVTHQIAVRSAIQKLEGIFNAASERLRTSA